MAQRPSLATRVVSKAEIIWQTALLKAAGQRGRLQAGAAHEEMPISGWRLEKQTGQNHYNGFLCPYGNQSLTHQLPSVDMCECSLLMIATSSMRMVHTAAPPTHNPTLSFLHTWLVFHANYSLCVCRTFSYHQFSVSTINLECQQSELWLGKKKNAQNILPHSCPIFTDF